MVDNYPNERMRVEMRFIDNLTKKSGDEILVYMIEKAGNELEKRSQEYLDQLPNDKKWQRIKERS